MMPQNILIGQIGIVFTIIIAATSAATQWAAHVLAYQTALGPAWFSVGATPVYYPWRLYEWWHAFEAYAPNVFTAAGTLAAARERGRTRAHLFTSNEAARRACEAIGFAAAGDVGMVMLEAA